MPAKSAVLAHLDKAAAKPPRKARALLVLGTATPPLVREVLVTLTQGANGQPQASNLQRRECAQQQVVHCAVQPAPSWRHGSSGVRKEAAAAAVAPIDTHSGKHLHQWQHLHCLHTAQVLAPEGLPGLRVCALAEAMTLLAGVGNRKGP